MPATTCIEPLLEPGVSAVLRDRKAEAAFQTACDVARSCFPEMRLLQVDLLDDPDVDHRVWVMLNVFLPGPYSVEALSNEQLRFHEAMVMQVPLDLNPLFGLSVRFQPE